ncbi:MAG: hypothetical protein ACSHW1_05795 [Yoonia sp.]|uniref:hypothetical protein n=1 Tax=Yoonia sp. TaxID=2212373 RepID=UPI003EF5F106
MQFAWPTVEQVTYRVMRLRRLIAIAVTLPTLVLLAVTISDPTVLSAAHATYAALGIAGLVIAHAVLFPNVTLETVALSLSATTLVIAMPIIKAVSHWAPEPHQTALFILLMGFALAATGVVMAFFQIILGALVYSGPLLNKPLKTSMTVPCSPRVARQQFSLRPDTRRGRILTSVADDNGFFDVAFAAAGVPDDDGDVTEELIKVDAKVMHECEERHDVMMVLRNGSVTVTSQKFVPHEEGCEVQVSDLPGDFTYGMHALFWLTDQQADNLTETHDMLTGQEARANSLSHNVSLLSVAGTVLSPRAPETKRVD